MKAFEIKGHTEDMHGWGGEPITAKIVARNVRDAIRRFKQEYAMIVTNVTPIALDEAL